MSNTNHDRSNDDTSTNAASRRTAAKRVPAGIAVVVVLVILAVVFTKSDNKGAKPDTSTSTVATPTTLSAGEQKVLADYQAFGEAFLVAANPPRADHPLLQQYATGDELRQLVSSFSAMHAGDEVVRGTIDHAPKVVSLIGDQATIDDCLFDKTGIFHSTTGEQVDTFATDRQLDHVQLVLIDGTWKVSSLKKVRDGCEPQ